MSAARAVLFSKRVCLFTGQVPPRVTGLGFSNGQQAGPFAASKGRKTSRSTAHSKNLALSAPFCTTQVQSNRAECCGATLVKTSAGQVTTPWSGTTLLATAVVTTALPAPAVRKYCCCQVGADKASRLQGVHGQSSDPTKRVAASGQVLEHTMQSIV